MLYFHYVLHMRNVLYYLKHEVETVVRRTNIDADVNLPGLSSVTYFIYYIFLSTCPADSREYKSNFKSRKSIFEKTNTDKRSVSHLTSTETFVVLIESKKSGDRWPRCSCRFATLLSSLVLTRSYKLYVQWVVNAQLVSVRSQAEQWRGECTLPARQKYGGPPARFSSSVSREIGWE